MRPGFDNSELNYQLLLSLPFREGADVVTRDWSKAHREFALVSTPPWTNLDNGLTVLEFVADPDALTCPGADSADLDFTSEDFSLASWARHDDIGSAHVIMNRGVLNTCGWEWYTASGNLALRTNQAGDREGASGLGFVVTGTWQFLGMVRDGLVGRAYLNGVERGTLQTDNGLLDPVACGVQVFRVGNNPHNNSFDGYLWNPRVWDRIVSSSEMLAIFESERDLFGV